MGFWGDEHEFTQRVSIQLTLPGIALANPFSARTLCVDSTD